MNTGTRAGRHWRGVFAASLSALLLTLSSTGVARAEGPWEDRYRGQCCYETIESGAVEPQYFEFDNAGSETWGAAGTPSVALATDEPRNRASVFAAPEWASPSRPVANVSHPVASGESYRFAFNVKAPVVSEPTVFREYFALVAEGVTWMDDDSGLGTTTWLEYRVVPATPPTIAITSFASALTQGSSLTVEASATDVASLNHIEIVFAGQEYTEVIPRDAAYPADEQTAWHTSATFQTGSLGGGPQTIVATAVDDAGLSSTTTATVNVTVPTSPPIQVANPTPSVTPAAPPIVPEFGLTIAGRVGTQHRIRLTRMLVNGAPRGAKVIMKCKRCFGVASVAATVGAHRSVTFRPRSMAVRPDSELTVDVVSPIAYGRYDVYDFRGGGGDATLRKRGCLLPGKTTRVSCPV